MQPPKRPEKQSDSDRFTDEMTYHPADERKEQGSKSALRPKQGGRDRAVDQRLPRK